MVLDIHFERGFAEVDHRFGDRRLCHFPLFDFLKPLSFQWMCLAYLVMWLGKLVSLLVAKSIMAYKDFQLDRCPRDHAGALLQIELSVFRRAILVRATVGQNIMEQPLLSLRLAVSIAPGIVCKQLLVS